LGAARFRASCGQSRSMEEVGRHRARPAARYCALAELTRNTRLCVSGRATLRRCSARRGERMTQPLCSALGLLCAISIAGAQSSGQLQQQLQELKQQYAETTRALEQRIAALEQQIEKERTAAAAPKEGTV